MLVGAAPASASIPYQVWNPGRSHPPVDGGAVDAEAFGYLDRVPCAGVKQLEQLPTLKRQLTRSFELRASAGEGVNDHRTSDRRRVRQGDCGVDYVAEFAHVARPLVLLQCSNRGRGQLHLGQVDCRCPLRKDSGEDGDVIGAIDERWDVDHEGREPMCQIVTKPARLEQSIQRLVERRHDAKVAPPVSARTEASTLA